mmetsp:Transcript_61573/g.144297  ORF Transcript_61573/g.144297 Transcript_61573/m.144297 type:complete len:550 (-) Transcript_61573:84-1733(-)
MVRFGSYKKSSEPPDWQDVQGWLQQQLDQKFAEQEAKIKDIFDQSQRSWGFGDLRSRALSEVSARNSGRDTRQAGLVDVPEDVLRSVRSVSMNPEVDHVENAESPASRHASPHHVTRILGKDVVREKLRTDKPFKTFVKKSLDSYMAIVVLINLGCIIAATEWTVTQTSAILGLPHPGWEGISPQAFETMEYIFFTIYLLDVMLRIGTLQHEWYYDQLEGVMYLNLFDAVLVVINIFELLVLPAIMGGDQQHATTIRVIKLVRIVRTLRIFKTVSLFRQLRILVGTCFASIGALFWSMVLLIVLEVGFALAMCQALQLYILDETADLATRLEMHNLYGSFARAFYTMFEITFSGSWPARVRPVIEKVDVWYSVPFMAYITFVVFAAIKIVTALFLKETLISAANDADMVMEDARREANNYQKKLEELFHLADDDGDGNLSRDEFVETMSLASVQHYLRTLNVSVQDCRPLFDILDDGDGLITIAEFCRGITQLQGHARAVDFVILKKENAKIMGECERIRKAIALVQKSLRPDSLERSLTLGQSGTWSA